MATVTQAVNNTLRYVIPKPDRKSQTTDSTPSLRISAWDILIDERIVLFRTFTFATFITFLRLAMRKWDTTRQYEALLSKVFGRSTFFSRSAKPWNPVDFRGRAARPPPVPDTPCAYPHWAREAYKRPTGRMETARPTEKCQIFPGSLSGI